MSNWFVLGVNWFFAAVPFVAWWAFWLAYSGIEKHRDRKASEAQLEEIRKIRAFIEAREGR